MFTFRSSTCTDTRTQTGKHYRRVAILHNVLKIVCHFGWMHDVGHAVCIVFVNGIGQFTAIRIHNMYACMCVRVQSAHRRAEEIRSRKTYLLAFSFSYTWPKIVVVPLTTAALCMRSCITIGNRRKHTEAENAHAQPRICKRLFVIVN